MRPAGEDLRRLQASLAAGAFGERPTFHLQKGDPYAGLDQPLISDAQDELALLSALFGQITPLAAFDDAAGGPPAECEISVQTADGAIGKIVLSRLRALPSSLTVSGAGRAVQLDLNARAVRSARQGLRRADNPDTPSPRFFDVAAFEAACAPVRARRAHVWESDTPSPEALALALAGQTALVLGASGFIGARLVEELALAGVAVTAGVRGRLPPRLLRLGVPVLARELGALTPDDLVKFDVVFNLAYDVRADARTNLQAFERLMAALAAARRPRLVHVSSIAVYDDWPGGALDEDAPSGEAGSAYKTAKMAMEAELLEASRPSYVLQPTIVYGPFSSLWTDEPAQRLKDGVMLLPEACGDCPAVYVDDVVTALLAGARATPTRTERYIVSGPAPAPWSELFEGYASALGRSDAVRAYTPVAGAASTGLRAVIANPLSLGRLGPVRAVVNLVRKSLGERALDRLRQTVARRRPSHSVFPPQAHELRLYLSGGRCSIEKAQRELDWRPRFDLVAGLAKTGAYLRWRYGEDAGRST